MIDVINGDNIEVLKQYPDNFFDAVVTDPPYGLGEEPDANEVMQSWITNRYHEVKGSGFMGKEWDAFVPQPNFWREVFRVLKPGGHVLAFYGTRTYDWGVMAMRFAGFEVRDTIQWHYGSGFPKSHNIGKAVDKLEGNEREIVPSTRHSGRVENSPYHAKGIVDKIPTNSKGNSKWEGWGSALKPASEPIVLARKPLEKGLSIAENVLKYGTGGLNIDGCRVGNENRSYKGSGSQPNKIINHDKGDTGIGLMDGRGKDLEFNVQGRFPANLIMTHHPECECKGMKKVKGTSTGNGDAPIGKESLGVVKPIRRGKFTDRTDENGEEEIEDWNCHPDCPIRIMDEQSLSMGMHSAGNKRQKDVTSEYDNSSFHAPTTRQMNRFGDTGGASRFFYCAKASKSERNKGLDKERWFYDLELIFDKCSFTEQNLFIWEQEALNQNMDSNGEVRQKKDISEGIVLLVEGKECYTTLFGNEKGVLFPKAIRFTTSTGISQTIELKTLNFYQPLSISDCIADVIETQKANGLSLAENVGIKNLLKQIFTKDEMEFLRGVKTVVKKTPQLINVKDVWQKTNIHSTVKPVKLMQYLVRLITPPSGIVLDPFCGSGTTGIACRLDNFQFVGIEQDAEYCKIAEARINNYVVEEDGIVEDTEKVKKPAARQKKSEKNTENSTFVKDKIPNLVAANQLKLF